MSEWTDGPHRRHRWVLDIQAHSLEEFQAEMRHILFEVVSKDHFPVICSGGGWHCQHYEDPDMTEERWRDELKEWCEERRKQRAQAQQGEAGMKLRFYGYSDDLVAVEGDISDEYGAWKGAKILLVAPNATALQFQASYDGDWSFHVLHEPADGWSFEIDPEPAHEYSQAANIEAPEGTRIFPGMDLCGKCKRPDPGNENTEEIEARDADLYCWGGDNCQRGQARLAQGGPSDG